MLKKSRAIGKLMELSRAIALVALVMIPLTACAPKSSSVPFDCPPLVNYSGPVQQKAADDLEALPGDSTLPHFMADYMDLRNMIRARGCNG